MTSPKPTDSEQLEHFANSIGWKLGKTSGSYVRSGFQAGKPGFGMMSAEAMASLWERDQQRLSAALEALPKQWILKQEDRHKYSVEYQKHDKTINHVKLP